MLLLSKISIRKISRIRSRISLEEYNRVKEIERNKKIIKQSTDNANSSYKSSDKTKNYQDLFNSDTTDQDKIEKQEDDIIVQSLQNKHDSLRSRYTDYDNETYAKSLEQNRPWDFMFRYDRRLGEYQKVKRYRAYIKQLEESGKIETLEQKREDHFKKIAQDVESYQTKLHNENFNFTAEERDAEFKRILNPLNLYTDFEKDKYIREHNREHKLVQSDRSATFRYLSSEEEQTERTHQTMHKYINKTIPTKTDSDHVDLQHRYKDYNWLKNVLNTRTISLNYVQDMFADSENNQELSDHQKFTKYQRLKGKMPLKPKNEVERELDLTKYEHWYDENKKMVKNAKYNRDSLRQALRVESKFDIYWKNQEIERQEWMKKVNFEKMTNKEPEQKRFKRKEIDYDATTKYDFLSDHQKVLASIDERLNLDNSALDKNSIEFLHKTRETDFSNPEALSALINWVFKEYGYELTGINDEIKVWFEELYNTHNETKRMSPWAKEEIFQLWLKGYEYADISYRFGICIERVVDTIFDKKRFYEEEFPRTAPSILRNNLMKEVRFGQIHGFSDYGLDLHQMAQDHEASPSLIFGEFELDRAKYMEQNKFWDDKCDLLQHESLHTPIKLEGRVREEHLFKNRSLLHSGRINKRRGIKPDLKLVRFISGRKAVRMNKYYRYMLTWGNSKWKRNLIAKKFKNNLKEGKSVYDSSKYSLLGTTYGKW